MSNLLAPGPDAQLQGVYQRLMQQLCQFCGNRRGLHRYGDEACPNNRWAPGNGQPQWVNGFNAWRKQNG